jgi:type VI protein secretion system component Hcp
MTMKRVETGRMAALLGAAFLFAGLAQADVILKVGGKDISATTLSFNVSHQPVYDPETYVPVVPAQTTFNAGSIYVTRNFDGASTQILKHVIGNTKLGSLEMVVSDAGSRTVWTLSDAVLNNYSTYSGENNQLIENFDITYKRATLKTFNGNSTSPSDTVSWEATSAVPVTQGE